MSTVAQQNERQVEIKNAMLFAWKGYRKHAWGADEMKPVEGKSAEPAFGGVGCTLIESLDTLLLMGLQVFDFAVLFSNLIRFRINSTKPGITFALNSTGDI